jgi:hypothetical protein
MGDVFYNKFSDFPRKQNELLLSFLIKEMSPGLIFLANFYNKIPV